MKIIQLFGTVMLAGFISHHAQANVCENKTLLGQTLHKTQFSSEDDLYACKLLPHENNTALLAVAEFVPHVEEEYEGDYALHLFKANAKTGQILKKYLNIDTFVSDAVALRGIEIDTAAYQLNSKLRAIGVRTQYEGGSRVYPYNNSTLHLYDLENKKTLLTGLVVDLYRGENDSRCNSEWEEHRGVLHMLNSKSKGFADIRMTINIKSEGMQMIKGECEDLPTKQDKVSFILKYDGKTYRVPKPFSETYVY